MMGSASGQSTVEILISASLLMITITGVGWIFKAEWERGKCAYLDFEKTHAALVQSDGPKSDISVQIDDEPDSVTGVALCKNGTETLTLPKLQIEVQK